MTTDERLAELRRFAAAPTVHRSEWAEDVRFLLAELDAARAREQELTGAIGENCDVQRAIEALPETRAQFEARILKREAKLREALKPCAFGVGGETCQRVGVSVASMCHPCASRAALAEGEDTRG